MSVPQWNENSKSYLVESKPDTKDRIEVEVGDAVDPSEFHPQMKLKRWDNEANVSFRLVHDFIPGVKITNDEQNGVITWTKKVGNQEWIARFYEDWGTPEGAYKFVELVMPAKPPTNQISFTTTSKDVNFWYQPPLTPEEIAEGVERPEEVVGSYAIYSTYRGGMNEVNGKEYKVGKIGHLYRAKLIDANGDEIWADYNTDLNETGILTITVDQTWLDNAVYPVILDPTFGYTSVGVSTYSIAENINDTDRIRAQRHSSPEDGTIDNIIIYLDTSSGTGNAKGVVYEEDSVSTGNHGLIASGSAVSCSTTPAWKTSTISESPSITSSTIYLLGGVGDWSSTSDEDIRMWYDVAGGAEAGYYNDSAASYDPVTDPLVDSSYVSNRQASVYVTYSRNELICDDFNREDSDTLGTGWTEDSGDWDIASNRASSTTGSIATVDASNTDGGDCTIEADLLITSSVAGVGVVARLSDTSNYYRVSINTFAQVLELKKVVGGSSTTLASYSGGYSTSTTYSIVYYLYGDSHVVLVDGTERINITDTAITGTSSQKVGIWSDSNVCTVDNFCAYGPAAPAGSPTAIDYSYMQTGKFWG